MNKLYSLTLFTLALPTITHGSYAEIARSANNRISTTIQTQASATARIDASNARIQELVAQYYQDNILPDLEGQEMRQFMATLQENALASDATFYSIKSLQAILHKKNRDIITNETLINSAAAEYPEAQFLQDLKKDIAACKTNLPRLKQGVANEHAQLASDKDYKQYLTYLKSYLKNMQNNYKWMLNINDEYPTYSQERKEATRIQFYQNLNRLGAEYKQLHETDWLNL